MYTYIYLYVYAYSLYVSNFCWRNYIGMLYKLSFLFSISQYRLGKTVTPLSYCHAPYFDVVMTMKNGKKNILQMIPIQQALTINVLWFISLITTIISYCLDDVQLDSVAVVVKTLHSECDL